MNKWKRKKPKPQQPVLCAYCGKPAKLITGQQLYPHRRDLWHKEFWSCELCVAYVGCHEGTRRPLGRLANAELRAAKMAAHDAFDPLWRASGVRRNAAYRWLATAIGVELSKCHIGMFDVATCQRVVSACSGVMPNSLLAAEQEEVQ